LHILPGFTRLPPSQCPRLSPEKAGRGEGIAREADGEASNALVALEGGYTARSPKGWTLRAPINNEGMSHTEFG